MLILAILWHALDDPHFKCYRDRWMLQGTLTALLNEFYHIPDSIQFSESDFRLAVSCRNQKQLIRYGFGTINERNFTCNTCRVYVSDPHRVYVSDPHCESTDSTSNRFRRVAFYLQDRKAEEVRCPTAVAGSQSGIHSHSRISSSETTMKESSSATKEEGEGGLNILCGPPKMARLTRASTREMKKRKILSVDEIRSKYGARKSSRRAKNPQIEHALHPPTSSKAWFKGLLDFHVGVVDMLVSHEPIEIEDEAVIELIQEKLNEVRSDSTRAVEDERKKAAREHVSKSAVGSHLSIYWYLTDAINLFSPKSDHDTNIYGVLLERVSLLEAAIESSEVGGWNEAFYKLIEGNPKDSSEFSFAQLTKLKAKIICVKLVTMEAMKIMGSGENGQNFERCCRNVIKKVSTFRGLGMKQFLSQWQTIKKWHAEFCTHGKFLRGIHPSRDNNPLPRILVDYPCQALAIKKFVKTELEGITAESVCAYIRETILPNIAVSFIKNNSGEWDDEDREVQSVSISEVLSYYGMKTFSISTTLRWMHALGMKYDERKKNYYVDGHERDDVVLSRWKFISSYLRREVQMCRWVQVSDVQLKELMKEYDSILEDHGYHYLNDKNESMVTGSLGITTFCIYYSLWGIYK